MLSSVFTSRKYFSWLYLFIGLCDLTFIFLAPHLRAISKPLIMLSMALYFYSNTHNWDKIDILFFIGLIAAWFGDVFLLFPGERWFLAGLGSFMLMQILYSVSFFKDSFVPSLGKFIGGGLLAGVLYFFLSQFDALGEMRIPVIVYSSCITLMAFFAICRGSKISKYAWVVLGAALFMISDGLIGWTQFNSPIIYSGIAVMSTYILAQYFIVLGFMQRSNI